MDVGDEVEPTGYQSTGTLPLQPESIKGEEPRLDSPPKVYSPH